MFKWAERTIKHNMLDRVTALASVNYDVNNMSAAVSSGSFLTEGINGIPCSMRTLGRVAHGYGTHLIHRAADVVLKTRWRLAPVPRKTPLSEVHIGNMLKLMRIGVNMLPPMPPFNNHPSSIHNNVDNIATPVLDQSGIAAPSAKHSNGCMQCLARVKSPRVSIAAPDE